jgi:[protein-PII] uridylyltransferase
MSTPCDKLCDWPQFDQALAEAASPLAVYRAQLKASTEALTAQFEAGVPVQDLVAQRASLVDALLTRIWQRGIAADDSGIALVAVGGYGRGELHPASDIDLLILTASPEETQRHAEHIEQFLLFLWDLGLEIGHSTRSLEDCREQAAADITVATNLMEARLLVGPESLFETMKEAVGPQHVWPGLEFFRAKREEQVARHHRFNDSAYNLEPNIKENPGGLRDLQVIGWVAKRHFGADTLHDLVGHGFLSENEYDSLMAAQNFLWRIRFGLHILTGRREDRLLFDHQRTLATQFGYQDQDGRLAVERFMKDYYRTVLELSRLNELLLDLFEEEILYQNDGTPATPINERFQTRHGKLEAVHDDIFVQEPWALLELFVRMARDPELRGVQANTIRLIRDHCHLIDDDFRHDPRCHVLFMELFRQGVGLTHELRRMNRYGVLAAYIPAFGDIVGQMQHDLFHVYTVDEHTMFVVRNLRRFTVPKFRHEFPLCSKIIQRIQKQEVLTLSGFFHDIGKGRGGDHSQLGAEYAVEFCQQHKVSQHGTELVKWLVQNHLLMSTTAQRKDISDPEIISQFAEQIGSQKRLDHLYLLTVADIRATSPSLWNSWKDALLIELYNATSHLLRHGLEKPIDQQEFIDDTQEEALQLLAEQDIDTQAIHAHWQRLGDDYFLRHSADEVAWHTRAILEHGQQQTPLILVRGETHRGGTEIFVYTRDADYLFAIITATLEQLGLDIIDARIITSSGGYTLDTFLVLDRDGTPINNLLQQREISQMLHERLKHPEQIPTTSADPSRQLRHFPIDTKILFRDDAPNQRTQMEVIAGDRPGLLARIARGLLECQILLQNAKIATFGERAEDIFFVTNHDHQPLGREEEDCLRETISLLLED